MSGNQAKVTTLRSQTKMKTTRNKRAIAIPYKYIQTKRDTTNSRMEKSNSTSHSKVLYRYPMGYLLFELQELDMMPLQVWRDRKTGRYPLKTEYCPNLLRKINQHDTVYTNCAELLRPLYANVQNPETEKPIKIVRFTQPVDALLRDLRQYVQQQQQQQQQRSPSTISIATTIPTFDDVYALDNTLTRKEYNTIYA